ncbi:MAG TPA: CoA transferase [Dehalococcoidia bacterium]|nr:CoA transferase [Dehalococcoidia bacterium]
MSGPLDDLRVIDLSSGQAGSVATMVFADFGADVLMVEPAEGNPIRGHAASPMWLRGKRSITLDLDSEAGREQLHSLGAGADVVIASYLPGEAEAVQADYATLSALNPGLVYTSITGFGPNGPLAGYPVDERVVAAKSGRMLGMTGLPSRDGPAFAAVLVANHAASQATVHGTLAALHARESLGRGQQVHTSLLQGLLPYDLRSLFYSQLSRIYPHEFPAMDMLAVRAGFMPTLNYHPVQTKDGSWIQLGNLLQHLFEAYLTAIDLIEIVADERYAIPRPMWTEEAHEELRDRMLTRMRERGPAEWMQAFVENGSVAATPFVSTQQALDDPDLVLNGHVVEVDHPRLGAMRQLGPIARLTGTPASIGGIDPQLGEHSDEVAAEPARTAWASSANGTTAPQHALEGITVLEFATIIATPLACSMLGDQGARIIKVEQPGGDPFRTMGAGGQAGIGAAKTNAGKESICLDLRSEAGQEVVHRLIADADMIIHNYRPGVPDRLGMSYEQAKAIKPDIIYLSVNGYGPDGPGAHRPSTHPIAGAASGGALFQAGSGMPPDFCDDLEGVRFASKWLMRANEVNPDPNTSMAVTSAAMLGLHARDRSGEGQEIFVDMLGANVYANGDDFISYAGKQPRAELDAELYGQNALSRLYPTREGWVLLSAPGERAWDALCETLPRSDLASDPRFTTAEARAEHDEELVADLADVFATQAAEGWEQLLVPAGVGCVRADAVPMGDFWIDDEQVLANEMAPMVDHPEYGPLRRHGAVVTFDATPGRFGPGCLAGDHTDDLLAEVGYDDAAIAELRASGVAWSQEVVPVGVPAGD